MLSWVFAATTVWAAAAMAPVARAAKVPAPSPKGPGQPDRSGAAAEESRERDRAGAPLPGLAALASHQILAKDRRGPVGVAATSAGRIFFTDDTAHGIFVDETHGATLTLPGWRLHRTWPIQFDAAGCCLPAIYG